MQARLSSGTFGYLFAFDRIHDYSACLNGYDTQRIRDMRYMFMSSWVKSAPLFNTENVTEMNNVFNNCSLLISLPNYNTSKVNNFTHTFDACSILPTFPS